MTVYEIPNIENCTVTPVSNNGIVLGYRIITNSGWVISLPQYEENNYSTAVILLASFDFSTVQILPISELPDGYVINGTPDNEHEIM